ncbi:hypothetical protein GMLC_05170 [Geomonas limicola]|uniref:Lipoprotein n=1 Tax=Geomonas limicola TaxID=2740186 RepID=A0A6V8N324_9BACT|nr:hypothetical protein [Geomonas limicola]GFO66938.1 hypothetical protein GMLC_05170 [Geomonas limicola]
MKGLLGRVGLAALLLASLGSAGCVAQRDVAGAVLDPEFRWNRSGFSVLAPEGSTWNRVAGNNPGGIAFVRGEGLYYAEVAPRNAVYVKGENAFAVAIHLKPAITARTDQERATQALQQNLERYLAKLHQKATRTRYDRDLGLDCLKYQAVSTEKRLSTEKGELHLGGIYGYLCVHPEADDFGVIMQCNNFGTVWTDIEEKKSHWRFFSSLRFLPRGER